MKHNHDIETSQALEHVLAASIDKVKDQITKSAAIKKQILSMRRARKQIEAIPDEVKQWFEDVENEDEEE